MFGAADYLHGSIGGSQASDQISRIARAARGASRPPRPDRGTEGLDWSIVADRAGLTAMAADWNALFEAHAAPQQVFQAHAWISHWADVYLQPVPPRARNTALAIVVAREGHEMRLVAPFVLETRLGLRRLSWCGAPVSQYGDVLVGDVPDRDAALTSALDFAIEAFRPDVIDLRKVRADAAIRPVLDQRNAIVIAHEQAPYMDLSFAPDAASYAQRASKRSRKGRRRMRRLISEAGSVEFNIHTSGPDALEAARHAVALKRDALKERGVVRSPVFDKRFETFFANIVGDETKGIACLVSTLTCNDDVASLEIGLSCKGHYFGHVCSFTPEYARFSPGTLLVEDLVAHGYDNDWRILDHLAPASSYKLSLSDDTVAVCDYALATSVAGRAFVHGFLGLVRPAAKQAQDHVSGLLRRVKGATAPAQA